MRLWTVHPKYLDPPGLVALWRESLLALKVLRGKTTGYRNHPQLYRFRAARRPISYLAAYLEGVLAESIRRGYQFDAMKVPGAIHRGARLAENSGQLEFEWQHLLAKLANRNKLLYLKLRDVKTPEPHPLFRIVRGDVRSWEKTRHSS
ncbi:MAG: DNA lyase [Lentisphaerales bacterium]|jgi:hypothetical protein|nr:MAG: DNA lyase [Lentisphaerales bacterium]